jgi:hypothetical protein
LIKLLITYPRVPSLTFNFKLAITVTTQELNGRNAPLLNKVLFIPETKISIGPFDGGKIYKIECNASISSKEYTKTIFVFVGSWGEQSESEYSEVESHIPHRHEVVEVKRNAK